VPDTISTAERDWRYIPEHGWITGSFTEFLKNLGINLPVPVHEMVQLGWLEPRLRVLLPPEFFTTWTNYPLYHRDGPVPPGLEWAITLVFSETMPTRPGQPLPDRWYEHYLDQHDEPEVEAIWEHAIPSDRLQEPTPTLNRDRGTIRTSYDLFAYWQAYALVDLLPATKLFKAIRNTSKANEQLTNSIQYIERYQRYSNDRIASIKRRWQKLAPVFDWLSRYRTLIGLWMFHEHPMQWETRRTATHELATRLNLTGDQVQNDIRNELLVLWKEWETRTKIPARVRGRLRQDIHRAFELLSIVADQPIDFDDPFWNPRDREPRAWAVPADVLPFENSEARRSLPRTAPIFLDKINALLPPQRQLTTPTIKTLIDHWWDQSPALQRLVLHLHRLHHSGGSPNEDDPLTFEHVTTIDQLILVTGSAERLFLERYLQRRGGSAKAPGFRGLLLETIDRITGSLGIPPVRQDVDNLLEKTQLHDLTTTPKNPFAAAHGLPITTLPEQLIAAAFNVATMRNYAAHHDVLDDDLLAKNWGREPLESIHVLAMLLLQADH
jgi:hypothetical protein